MFTAGRQIWSLGRVSIVIVISIIKSLVVRSVVAIFIGVVSIFVI
jgi:hypothetical protein